MEHLTKQTFIEKIFDYENSNEWNFKGTKPAIIDFYADWCGPCKMVSPILEEIAKEYEGLIDIYKIDTEAEQELAIIIKYFNKWGWIFDKEREKVNKLLLKELKYGEE